MPSLDQSCDEQSLRNALLGLEKHVSTYCHSHDIGSPPHDAPSFFSLPPGLEATNGVRRSNGSHPRSSTPTQFWEVTDSPEIVSLPGASKAATHSDVRPKLLRSSPRRPPPPPPPPQAQSTPVHHNACPTVPSGPPPPPPPPPPPVPMMVPHGVRGTGQFAGSQPKRPTEEPRQREQPQAPLPGNLLDDIASIGRANLRTTSRARSPGGTPLKQGQKLVIASNNDVLQRALLNRFQSIHCTPKRYSHSSDRSSFDASAAWSDINGSVDIVDPDITGSELSSGFMRNASKTSTAV